jgi:Ca2+-binding RTX toxin-like protein
MWLIAQDAASNHFAQQFNVNVGTSAANNITLPAGTTVGFAVGGGDTVAGTTGGDAISGGAGNDTLNGGVGNDTLSGGAGNDTLNGGADNDTLIGGVGIDVMHGDDGSDTLVIAGTEAQGDTLDGGTGTDAISVAGSGDVTLASFNAASSLIESWQGNGHGVVGTGAADTFDLGGLSDVSGLAFIDGGGGNDALTGSNFADDLRGGAGNDTLVGLSGSDILTGGAGNDIISGGEGDDVIVIAGTDAQTDAFDGGAGTDTISVIGTTDVTLAALDTASASIETWQGNGFGIVGTGAANAINLSSLTTINGLAYVDGGGGDDVVTGSSLADDLRGGTGNDTLSGLAGDDTLTGGVGNDTMAGGDGDDTFSVAGTEAQGDSFDGGAGSDAILVTGTTDLTLAGFNAATSSVERWRGNGRGVVGTSANNTFDFSALAAVAGLLYVDGASGNDLITGTALADVSDDLRGGSGDDTIVGLAGNDVLSGGTGNDTLSGGDGDDTFLVAGAEAKGDSFNGGLGLDTISVTGTADVTLTSFDSTASSIEAWQGNGAAIVGTTAIDTINLAGLISISGLSFVDGGGGDDVITGSNLADDLRGGAGNDTLIGLGGNDVLSGGARRRRQRHIDRRRR